MVAAPAEVAGPKSFWPIGHVVQFRREPLALLTRPARECGGVTRFLAATQSVYLLNHPALRPGKGGVMMKTVNRKS